MGDFFDNEAAAKAARLLAQEVSDDDFPGVFPITFRLPPGLACLITVMAEHAGVSRNEMGTLILRAGVDAVRRETPPDVQAEIDADVGHRVDDFIN